MKLVRALIVAVRLYTGRAVDVVGYSLGVPVSRKAILGGRCVDTGEDLGAPLTKFVDTYIGVAGPNHGIALQVGGIQVPGCVFSVVPICNRMTGLYSGFCPAESDFLQDINRQQGYEGQNRFSIYSQADQIVGHTVCQRVSIKLILFFFFRLQVKYLASMERRCILTRTTTTPSMTPSRLFIRW